MKLTISNTYSKDFQILSVNDLINIPFDEIMIKNGTIELYHNDSFSCNLSGKAKKAFSEAVDKNNKTQTLNEF